MLVAVDLNEAELELVNKLKECTNVRTRSEILRRGIWTMKDIFLQNPLPASRKQKDEADVSDDLKKGFNKKEIRR